MRMMKKCLALITVLMMLPFAAMAEETASILELHQFNLGYADGYFIRCGDIDIMIDGGNPNPNAPTDDVVNTLRALGCTELDVYIATHWHLDHVMNMNIILAQFGTDATVTYGVSAEPVEYIENEGKRYELGPLAIGTYQQMKVDDVIQIGPMTFTCIGPEELGQNGRGNADSLNFVLQYGTRRILFTGDYAQSGEINKRHPELCKDVDVLKFPHHGGKPYVIGNNACRNTSPEYVLVPSQLNNYQIWQFLRDNGVPIERDNVLTNRAGHVVILTDGGEYIEARTEQNPADYAPKAE